MKKTFKTGLTVLVLLLITSCKKENNSMRSLPATDKSSIQDLLTNIDSVANNIIKIGTQKWMTTNLNVSRYRNGEKIPQVKDRAAWAALTTGAWCYYNSDPANGAIYGKLYNWYAVNDPRGLAPIGYHIPSDVEWTTLSTFLGGEAVAGGKMKETGTTHWSAPNTDATNSSGFTGLPGGYRNDGGNFDGVGLFNLWWSSTESNTGLSWYRTLGYFYGGMGRGDSGYWLYGYSVRCLKD